MSVIDEVYQRASVSGYLNSGRRMVRAGHNAKEVMIPKISVTAAPAHICAVHDDSLTCIPVPVDLLHGGRARVYVRALGARRDR